MIATVAALAVVSFKFVKELFWHCVDAALEGKLPWERKRFKPYHTMTNARPFRFEMGSPVGPVVVDGQVDIDRKEDGYHAAIVTKYATLATTAESPEGAALRCIERWFGI